MQSGLACNGNMGNPVILVQSYFMILHAWLIHQRLVLEGSKAGPKVLARHHQSAHWNHSCRNIQTPRMDYCSHSNVRVEVVQLQQVWPARQNRSVVRLALCGLQSL